MTCACGNLQCYVCGESVKDYRHFDVPRKDGKKCPLHEDSNQRLEMKIKKAQEDAVKKVLEEGEGLNEEDLKVNVPEVKHSPIHPPNQDRPRGPFGLEFPAHIQDWGIYPFPGPNMQFWGLGHQPQVITFTSQLMVECTTC